MANMGYCRFENTLTDLQDCYEHLFDEDLSAREKAARQKLVDLCEDILREVDIESESDSEDIYG